MPNQEERNYRILRDVPLPDCCMICEHMETEPDGCNKCLQSAYEYTNKRNETYTLYDFVDVFGVCDEFKKYRRNP